MSSMEEQMYEYSDDNFNSHKYQTRENLSCVVCSAPAFGMNFNAITCQSCKAFFRRNAIKPPHLLRCLKTRSCPIDIYSRRNCPSCRLQKCLAAGMNRQLIQTPQDKIRKKQYRLEQQQAKKLKQSVISTLNPHLLLLTDEDYFSLNHIRHAYETRTHYFHPYDILPNLFFHNNYFLHLTSLPELINARSISILRLISFFKLSSSQFQELNTDDKVTLVKYNIPTLFWINISLCYNPMTNTFCEDEQNDLIFDGRNLLNFYGSDIYNRIIKYLCLLNEFIQVDPIIIHLLILILLFSHFSSCQTLAEPLLYDQHFIRQTQNFYTTLLVRILHEKFGQQYADLVLSKLILICLNIQNLSRDISHIESTQIFNENILTLMKVFLIK